jgi:hypothetical protein
MNAQKDIARILDRAAAKSARPSTPKQNWFLAKLMCDMNDDGSEFLLSGRALSKDLASSLIETSLAALAARQKLAA